MNKKDTTHHYILHEPSTPAQGSIIWLHGLGADGSDLASLTQELDLPKSLPLRSIYPHAPIRSVEINQNTSMRAWFNIHINNPINSDYAGIHDSTLFIEGIIASEIAAGIPESNIILAGFSQGGVIAMNTFFKGTYHLGGFIALSTFLHANEAFQKKLSLTQKQTPLFLAHGSEDPVLPLFLGEALQTHLKNSGCQNILWQTYSAGHHLCPQEIIDLKTWIIQRYA